jgi:hypothetical protein
MAKSITDNHKKRGTRGRPKTTGTTPMTGVRLPADLEAAVLKWARLQMDKPSKAEAIRRLVERALAAEPPAPSARSKGAPKAAEMASREINKLGDETATDGLAKPPALG